MLTWRSVLVRVMQHDKQRAVRTLPFERYRADSGQLVQHEREHRPARVRGVAFAACKQGQGHAGRGVMQLDVGPRHWLDQYDGQAIRRRERSAVARHLEEERRWVSIGVLQEALKVRVLAIQMLLGHIAAAT